MKNIALINITEEITEVINNNKYNVLHFDNFDNLFKKINNIDLLIVDLENKFNAKDIFNKIKSLNKDIKILGLVNLSRARVATKLLKNNLSDYIIKDELRKIRLNINDIIDKNLGQNENNFEDIIPANNLINADIKVKKLIDSVKKIANTNMPILIQGEYGCEHELYAKAIHGMSPRRNKKFKNIFCQSLKKENIENILCGDLEIIEKSETQENGTIFLENIDCLDKDSQGILTRILDKKEVGILDTNNKSVNVRIICSTTKNLKEEVKNGNFKEELYFMINTFTMRISPLRELRSVIPLLVKNLYQYFAKKENKNIEGISTKALKLLENYSWTGNIKELKNVVYKAVILNDNGILDEKDFMNLYSTTLNENLSDQHLNIDLFSKNGQLKTMEILEREIIDNYLKTFNGNISEAAKKLNIGRTTLYRKLEQNVSTKD